MGVKLALGTDAHTSQNLDAMKLGISIARRGWLGTKDLINTLHEEELIKTIKKW